MHEFMVVLTVMHQSVRKVLCAVCAIVVFLMQEH